MSLSVTQETTRLYNIQNQNPIQLDVDVYTRNDYYITVVGYNANVLRSGYASTTVGHSAGPYNTGDYNTFIGAQTGTVNSLGHDNTFLGSLAGVSNNGSYNTFLGAFAGGTNAHGELNTYVGYKAGYLNDGYNNIFMGYNNTNTTEAKNVSTAISIGNNAFVTKNNSIGIGNASRVFGTNSVIIGNDSTTSKDSAIVLGNNVRNYGQNVFIAMSSNEGSSNTEYVNYEDGIININNRLILRSGSNQSSLKFENLVLGNSNTNLTLTPTTLDLHATDRITLSNNFGTYTSIKEGDVSMYAPCNVDITSTTGNITLSNSYGYLDLSSNSLDLYHKSNIFIASDDSVVLDGMKLVQLSQSNSTFILDNAGIYLASVEATSNNQETTSGFTIQGINGTTFFGPVNLCNDLHVAGSSTFSNSVVVQGAFDVFGAVNLHSNATVSGNFGVLGQTSLLSNLNLDGQLSVHDSATFYSNVSILSNLGANTLQITGDAGFNSNIRVTGLSTFSNDVNILQNAYMGSNLQVSGNGLFSNDLYVQKNAYINSNFVVNGVGAFSNTLNVLGNASFASNLNVSGNGFFNNNLFALGSTQIGSNLDVAGVAMFSNSVLVNGDALLMGSNVVIDNSLQVGGTSIFNSNVIFNDAVNAYSTTEFYSNVTFESNTNISYNNTTTTFNGGIVQFSSNVQIYGLPTYYDKLTVSNLEIIGDIDYGSYIGLCNFLSNYLTSNNFFQGGGGGGGMIDWSNVSGLSNYILNLISTSQSGFWLHGGSNHSDCPAFQDMYSIIDNSLVISNHLHVGGVICASNMRLSSLEVYGPLNMSGDVTFDSSNVVVNGDLALNGTLVFGSNATIQGLPSNDVLAIVQNSIQMLLPKDIVADSICFDTVDPWWTQHIERTSNYVNLVFSSKGGAVVTFDDEFSPETLNFTGKHRCKTGGNLLDEHKGMIVISQGIYMNLNNQPVIDIDEAIPVVELCRTACDKRVFGVVGGIENTGQFRIGHLRFKHNNILQRAIIQSIGEGGIWVCNVNGNLENGDYITSSSIPGLGMRQDSDQLLNYTVAKITCDCQFELSSSVYKCVEFTHKGKKYRKAFVGCIYTC